MLQIGQSRNIAYFLNCSAPFMFERMDEWKSIRLELAGTARFPAGSVSRGYIIKLPLNHHNLVDRAAFARNRHRATVRRYWSTSPDEIGLVHETEAGWAMRCSGKPDRKLLLDDQPVMLGQQVSVVETNGDVLPFEIASIR